MRRQLPTLVGVVLLVAAVAFCAATLVREHDRVADALGEARPAPLLLAALTAGAAMASLALGWQRCLAALGSPLPTGRIAGWYFAGELGKYLPGGIWPVVGRGELAARGGVPRGAAYQSVAWSLVCWYGAAALPVAAAGAHPAVQRRVAGAAARATRGKVRLSVLPWVTVTRLLVGYLPTWVLIGGTTALVMAAYDEPVGWRAPLVAIVAWVAGFAAVPVPAGAGVREAVFLAASGLPDGVGIVVAVTARLLFVAADLLGAVLTTAAGRMGVR